VLKLQEAENQIVVDYEVYARRPNDCDGLIPSLDSHRAKLARVPRFLAADAGFCSAKNEAAAKGRGVKRVCIPNRSTKVWSGDENRRSVGSATAKNGEPSARDGSVWSSADTASVAANTRASAECRVGSASG
jgi:hypothetical protein